MPRVGRGRANAHMCYTIRKRNSKWTKDLSMGSKSLKFFLTILDTSMITRLRKIREEKHENTNKKKTLKFDL